jgi:uncharacterized protein YkwD
MARRNQHQQRPALEGLEARTVLSAAPTAELQYALEVTNFLRTNPAQAADKLTNGLSGSTKDTLNFYGVDINQARQELAAAQPRQPLAWSDALAAAADDHSRDMADKGYQSHTGSDGSSPGDRAARSGYAGATRTAENAFAYAESVDQALQAFSLDWGVADKGHRRNWLEPDHPGDDQFQEVGIGVVGSQKLGTGPKVVTQLFGARANAQAQILGVAYNDRNGNRFYDPGEGRSDVTIDVTAPDGRSVAQTPTASPGGYQVPVAPGTYKVRALVNGREVQSKQVQVGTRNVKVDFVLSDAPSTPSTTPAPAKPVTMTVTKPNVAPAAKADTPTVSILTNKAATTTKATTKPVEVVSIASGDKFAWNTWKASSKK